METNKFDKSDLSSYIEFIHFFLFFFCFLLSLVSFKCREKKVSDPGKSPVQARGLKLRKYRYFSHRHGSLFTGVSLGFRGCDKVCSVQVEEMLKLQTRTEIVFKFMDCIRKL